MERSWKQPCVSFPTEEKGVTGYKGFDVNLCCRGFQYAVGQSFKHGGKVKVYNSGFHFCPLAADVLQYGDGPRYAMVMASGTVKHCVQVSACSEIRIIKELSLDQLLACMPDGEVVRSDGKREYYKNGKLHSIENQPAVIYADGTPLWYENGILLGYQTQNRLKARWESKPCRLSRKIPVREVKELMAEAQRFCQGVRRRESSHIGTTPCPVREPDDLKTEIIRTKPKRKRLVRQSEVKTLCQEANEFIGMRGCLGLRRSFPKKNFLWGDGVPHKKFT